VGPGASSPLPQLEVETSGGGRVKQLPKPCQASLDVDSTRRSLVLIPDGAPAGT